MDIENGILSTAKYIESPNQNDRPDIAVIDAIIIHGISLPPGEFGGGFIEQLFTNALHPNVHPYFETISDLRVSSHLLIDREGDVTQFVPFHKRAWHAGRSSLNGRQECNDFAIGIELEGEDDVAYTEQQYHMLSDVVKLLMQTYPNIIKDHIVAHSDVAPGRKNRSWDPPLVGQNFLTS